MGKKAYGDYDAVEVENAKKETRRDQP